MSMSASMRTRGCAAARALFSLVFTTVLFVSVSAAQIPSSQHVVLVIEENHDYAQVLASMPWLVSEGNANGYATNYFAESGGSLKDYLWLASGSCHNASACTLPAGTHDFGCTGDTCSSAITDDNIFAEMNAHGISWKVYAQSYDLAGGTVTAPDRANGTSYLRRHNGATWYAEILNNLDANQKYSKIVDFSQFGTDVTNNALPQFSIIVPDGAHDAHDSCNDTVTPVNCLQTADDFLKNNLGSMLTQSYFQPGGNGLLLVTFDECGAGTNSGCSNVYTAVIGPKVVPGTASGVFHQHSSTLRTMLEALGITTFMGGAASANDLSEFFNSPGPVLLADDFSSASVDTTKWSHTLFTGSQNTSVAVNDANGQLQIGPLPTNASSSSYNGITSLNRYDFTGADAYVQLVQPAAAVSNAFTMFAVGNDTNNFYRFYVSGGSLVCEQKIGGTKSQVGSTTYNATTQQFLRIRHDAGAGNVVWETAPNNGGAPGSWTQQCSAVWNTTAVPVTSVLFEMKAGTSVPESTAPGTILFDNFRAEKPVLLTDGFGSPSVDTTKWSNTLFTGSQNTTVAVNDVNGQLQIGPLPTNASSSSYNGITSLNRYDFTGAYAYVQLVQAAASNSNAFTMFAVGNDSSNFYRFYVSGGSLVCEKKIAGTKSQIGSAVYNAVDQQFLRIRHDASSGNVVYETAPNSSGSPGSWTQQCSEAWNTTAVPLNSVLFEMKAGTSVAEPNAPGTVIFDNFNAAKQ